MRFFPSLALLLLALPHRAAPFSPRAGHASTTPTKASAAVTADAASSSLFSHVSRTSPGGRHAAAPAVHSSSFGRFPSSWQVRSRSPASAGSSIALRASPAGWMALTLLGGNMSTPLVARATKSWYTKIKRPSWLPPNWLFAPVWVLLYCSMGYSACRVYERSGFALPIKTAAVHYALNVMWAPIFFGMKRLRLGHGVNVALVATLLRVIMLFEGVHPPSAYLLLPYLAWVTFATALSWSICSLNPTEGGYNNAMMEADILELQREAAKKAGL